MRLKLQKWWKLPTVLQFEPLLMQLFLYPPHLKSVSILSLYHRGVFLTLVLSPRENWVLIFLEFLYILLIFSKICLSFLSRLLEFFQKLGFWWKYWRNITHFCMFYANLTTVYTILGKKYLKTIWHFETHKVFCKKNSTCLKIPEAWGFWQN